MSYYRLKKMHEYCSINEDKQVLLVGKFYQRTQQALREMFDNIDHRYIAITGRDFSIDKVEYPCRTVVTDYALQFPFFSYMGRYVHKVFLLYDEDIETDELVRFYFNMMPRLRGVDGNIPSLSRLYEDSHVIRC